MPLEWAIVTFRKPNFLSSYLYILYSFAEFGFCIFVQFESPSTSLSHIIITRLESRPAVDKVVEWCQLFCQNPPSLNPPWTATPPPTRPNTPILPCPPLKPPHPPSCLPIPQHCLPIFWRPLLRGRQSTIHSRTIFHLLVENCVFLQKLIVVPCNSII